MRNEKQTCKRTLEGSCGGHFTAFGAFRCLGLRLGLDNLALGGSSDLPFRGGGGGRSEWGMLERQGQR